jgi:hypothetical protein
MAQICGTPTQNLSAIGQVTRAPCGLFCARDGVATTGQG